MSFLQYQKAWHDRQNRKSFFGCCVCLASWWGLAVQNLILQVPFPVVGKSRRICFHSQTHGVLECAVSLHPDVMPNPECEHESRNAVPSPRRNPSRLSAEHQAKHGRPSFRSDRWFPPGKSFLSLSKSVVVRLRSECLFLSFLAFCAST